MTASCPTPGSDRSWHDSSRITRHGQESQKKSSQVVAHREDESDAELDEGRRATLAGEAVSVAQHLEVVRARAILVEATARRIRRHHLQIQMRAKPREGQRGWRFGKRR